MMLIARPIPIRNSRHGMIYLEQAVTSWKDDWRYLPSCPDTLEVVLKHAKLDSMDFPLPEVAKPALYVLLESISPNYPFTRYNHITDQNRNEECRCSEETKFKKEYLSRCVYLLKHGANWTAKCPETGETPLDFIKAQREARRYCFVPFMRHNWDELEKHLVLDWEEYGDYIPGGFNPFEMDDIKATQGGPGLVWPVHRSKRNSVFQKLLCFWNRAFSPFGMHFFLLLYGGLFPSLFDFSVVDIFYVFSVGKVVVEVAFIARGWIDIYLGT